MVLFFFIQYSFLSWHITWIWYIYHHLQPLVTSSLLYFIIWHSWHSYHIFCLVLSTLVVYLLQLRWVTLLLLSCTLFVSTHATFLACDFITLDPTDLISPGADDNAISSSSELRGRESRFGLIGVTARLLQLGIQTDIFTTGLPALLSQSMTLYLATYL